MHPGYPARSGSRTPADRNRPVRPPFENEEERRFRDLVRRGRRVLDRPEFSGKLSDDDYRRLHDTYGLPRDLVTGLRAG